MFTKTTIVSLLTISLIAVAGLGYSQFTSSVTANANATGGTLNLVWYYAAADPSNVAYAQCSVANVNSQTETFTASAIAPGDNGCLFDVYIQNTGNVPANSITTSPASGTCLVAAASPSPTLASQRLSPQVRSAGSSTCASTSTPALPTQAAKASPAPNPSPYLEALRERMNRG